ncbi:hypothetical protein [Actinacidiphila sp. bgisy160]
MKKADEADFAKILSERDFDLFLSGNRSTDPFGARISTSSTARTATPS